MECDLIEKNLETKLARRFKRQGRSWTHRAQAN